MSERFYTSCSLQLGPVQLDGAEAHHLATVCRLRPGDAVCLFNGDGREYAAHIDTVGKRQVALTVTGQAAPARELPSALHVAAPLPRGDRAQFLLEKLTEIGVTSFTPLQTVRSVVLPREAKLDKLQRHVIEASKQCGRNVLLRVEPLTAWADFVRRGDLGEVRLLADPGGVALAQGSAVKVAIAVGPEGGLTEAEVAEACAAGWQRVALGPRILRVETAALVLASWLAMQGA